MNKRQAISVPKSDSPRDLLEWALPELAAQWDGSTEKVAIVQASAPYPLPSVYWMTRGETADYALERANQLKSMAPTVRHGLQQVAAEILDPKTAKRLYASVATATMVTFETLDADILTRLNKKGDSNNAATARKQLVQRLAPLMSECVDGWTADGHDPDKVVVLIADPTDASSSTVAHVLNAGVAKMTGVEYFFGEASPIVVASSIERAKELFSPLRPRISTWLDLAPSDGSVRVVCMAHGGITYMHGRVVSKRLPGSG